MEKNDKMINITLNGNVVSAHIGESLLNVANRNNIVVPTLCHDQRLKPYSSCFVCVFELATPKGKMLTPSCSTLVQEGMIVETDNDRIFKSRQTALNLLLSDHAGDCVAPCVEFCPAHTEVQGYVNFLAQGKWQDAIDLIKEKLALPFVCGTICPHPCEAECRRGVIDSPIEIKKLKLFAAYQELLSSNQSVNKKISNITKSNKKVAVIGGGPAGLAASKYLIEYGHEVHLFEARSQLGGMTRYGIPAFRLPNDLLDKEIFSIIDSGVHVHFNQSLGQNFTIATLKESGFDAILIAIGAHKSKKMGIPHEDQRQVVGGVTFLRDVVEGTFNAVEEANVKNVLVVGGGDVAMDCARVAKRKFKNSKVQIVYRRSVNEMPALHEEQEDAKHDGVEFKFLTAPKQVVINNAGELDGLEVVKMQLGQSVDGKRASPTPIANSETVMPADLIIYAIGQDPDTKILDMVTVTKHKTVAYDENVMTTSIEGVFSAGDCAFGPDTVVRALGEGKKAAIAINMYLSNLPLSFKNDYKISRGRVNQLTREEFAPRFAYKLQKEKNLKPKTLTTLEDVSQEASRCLKCGCVARTDCRLREHSTTYLASEKTISGMKRNESIDRRHPFIHFEADKCISCGLCVRYCHEVRQISALAFESRGFKTRVRPVMNKPLQDTKCDNCEECAKICPTGAIFIDRG